MWGIFRAIKRLFVAANLWADNATDNDSINEAQVEAGIRENKEKAEKAHFANGQLAGQIAMIKDQVKRQERSKNEIELMVRAAISQNDEANGAVYAEQLASVDNDLTDNKSQLTSLEELYKANTETIANSLREIQRFENEFNRLKVRVRISRSMEGLANMMKTSIVELQGMTSGEMGKSMESLRKAAASGEGQMRATVDLAKSMGANIRNQQEARKLRGQQLFQEYKAKMSSTNVNADKASVVTPVAPVATTAPVKVSEAVIQS